MQIFDDTLKIIHFENEANKSAQPIAENLLRKVFSIYSVGKF